MTRLDKYIQHGVFIGGYQGPCRSELGENFERNLAQIYARPDMPRLSGVQIKAPMYLDEKGVLSPAAGQPFTHILKPAGTSGHDALPVVEWIAMELGRAAGFEVPMTALVSMPDKMPPALLVERFDIRTSTRDTRELALEDMCSVLDLPTTAKYDGTTERVARAVRSLSTEPEDDLLIIVKRAVCVADRRWRHASQKHGAARDCGAWGHTVSQCPNGSPLWRSDDPRVSDAKA